LRFGHRHAQLVGGVPQPVLDLLLGHCHQPGVSLASAIQQCGPAEELMVF
jgi:hypothetical protein